MISLSLADYRFRFLLARRRLIDYWFSLLRLLHFLHFDFHFAEVTLMPMRVTQHLIDDVKYLPPASIDVSLSTPFRYFSSKPKISPFLPSADVITFLLFFFFFFFTSPLMYFHWYFVEFRLMPCCSFLIDGLSLFAALMLITIEAATFSFRLFHRLMIIISFHFRCLFDDYFDFQPFVRRHFLLMIIVAAITIFFFFFFFFFFFLSSFQL